MRPRLASCEAVERREPQPLTRAQAARQLRSGDAVAVTDALVAVAFHDPDWRWVQEQCFTLLASPEPAVRGLAATCLAQLDLDRALPVLRALRDGDQRGRRTQRAPDRRLGRNRAVLRLGRTAYWKPMGDDVRTAIAQRQTWRRWRETP